MELNKCEFCSDERCLAADMIVCDFEGDNYKKCLRYKLYYLNPQALI